MSFQSAHFPRHAFTSTLTTHKGEIPSVNIFIVILTALIFFTVLSWFNFALAFYGTLTSTDPDHVDITMNNFGFAIMWTVVTIAIYYAMEWAEVLTSNNNNTNDDEHPLLQEEGKSSVDPSNINLGDYVGDIGIL